MMFNDQIGQTVEVYVDGILVNSKEAGDYIKHLEEMFTIIMKYQMKLNPLK